MSDRNRKNAHDFINVFFKSLVVFIVIFAVGFCGFMFAVNRDDDGILPVAENGGAAPISLGAATPDPFGLPSSDEPDLTAKDDGKIARNIFVNDVAVGGLTREEALDRLKNELKDAFSEGVVEFSSEYGVFDAYLSDFGVTYDIESAVAKAYEYTRDADQGVRKDNVSFLKSNKYKIEADVTFDKAKLDGVVSAVAEEADVKPTEPSVRREGGEFKFSSGQAGRQMDKNAAAESAAETFAKGGGKVDLIFEKVEPRFSEGDVRESTDLLGSFSTKFSAGKNARNQNMINAASKIDNAFMLPGDVFSVNDALGEMTESNGYAKAPVILGNKLVDDYGGGVCQVSSTLYDAVLYAELEIVERTNHSLKVGYLDFAFDATLSTPVLDLKFRNNSDYPVLVESYATQNTIAVNIYGRETRPEGRSISFENERVATNPPGGEIIREDASLPLGQRVVDISAHTGYVYNLYKLIYQNGQFVDRVQVNKSSYKTVRAEVRVGTGPADAPPPEAPSDPTEVTDLEVIPSPEEIAAAAQSEPAQEAAPQPSADPEPQTVAPETAFAPTEAPPPTEPPFMPDSPIQFQ